MRNWWVAVSGVALAGILTGSMLGQESAVEATAVVTVMPKGTEVLPVLTAKDFKVNVNYKFAQATSVVPLRGDRAGLELMVLIDDSARSGLANQISDLKRFVEHLPDGASVGVAYMQNGRAVTAQRFTADRAAAANAFRIPQGSPGSNASPYFCLSDLAKQWPSDNPDVRREVLMVTDGVDAYGGRAFDPENPYVLAAIADAQRAHLIVHSIFFPDSGDNGAGRFGGQDYLLMVSRGTGGEAYYQMSGEPVSLTPYLSDLQTRLANQYEIGFLAEGRARVGLQPFKVKTTLKKVSVDAPEKVMVGRRAEGLNR